MEASEFKCRFNEPGASVSMTEKYENEVEELRLTEASTWEHLQALLLEAEEEGLPEASNAALESSGGNCTYRAPVGKRAMRRMRHWKSLPWVGEFRLDSVISVNGGGKLWRAYFHDLVEVSSLQTSDVVLMSSVQAKRVPTGGRRMGGGVTFNEQDVHIVNAVDAARVWIKQQNQYELRLQCTRH